MRTRTDIPDADFREDQAMRYARQLVLDGVGPDGQRILLQSSVLVVGAGGLGSPAAMYLAAAGVGRIGIVDGDSVELSNLQRQILHGTSDLSRHKTVSAAETLRDLNPDVQVDTFDVRADRSNIDEMIDSFDLVIDAVDNFPSKYLISDACVAARKPYVHAGVIGFQGQLFTWIPGSACLRCLAPPPSGELSVPIGVTSGIIGAAAGTLGTLQAVEAIKLILGIGAPLVNRLLVFDALELRFRELQIFPDPHCPACGCRSTGNY